MEDWIYQEQAGKQDSGLREVETRGQIQEMKKALALFDTYWLGQGVIPDTRVAMRRHGEC